MGGSDRENPARLPFLFVWGMHCDYATTCKFGGAAISRNKIECSLRMLRAFALVFMISSMILYAAMCHCRLRNRLCVGSTVTVALL